MNGNERDTVSGRVAQPWGWARALLWLCIGLVLGGVGAAEVSKAFFGKDSEPKAEAPEATTASPAPARAPGVFPPSFADLYEHQKRAVVNLSTTKVIHHPPMGRARPELREFFGDNDEFWKFFGAPDNEDVKQRSLGSGFVIDKDGYIITNSHVVKGADEVVAKFSDGHEEKAKIIGTDEKTDVALIRVDSAKGDLPHVELGDSDAVRIGDWVIAIGNPFGLEHTMTAGIVSAKERAIGTGPYDDFIQTDASINPGNSGGPLFDIEGRVIGINTAITATGSGIGFAVPINMAKQIVADLKSSGKVTRGWLGVKIQDLSDDLAKSLGLESAGGALIAEVIGEGPAAKAGLKRGDVVVELDGKKIASTRELSRTVASVEPGTQVHLEVLRTDRGKGEGKGKPEKLKIAVEVGTYPADDAVAAGHDGESQVLGLEVQGLTSKLAEQLGTDDLKGVVVTRVRGPASEAGIQRGDIIREVNRKAIEGVDDFAAAIKELEKDQPALLLIERKGSTLFVTVKPGS
ncbi:MAG: Do family serine endopeptidase [bacterium]